MKNNKYCRIISGTVLAEDKRSEIKRELKKAADKKCKKDVTVVSKQSYVRRVAFKWAAAIAAVAIIVVCAGCFLLPLANIERKFTVKNPIMPEEATHIADVAENAQYLPNAELLASIDNNASALSSKLGDGANDQAFKNVYKADVEIMSFSKGDYEEFNNCMATISGTATESTQTIDDLKFEISLALRVIPGYDQWFQLPYEVPGMSESESGHYMLNSYNLSYDEESEKITMRRLGWKTRGETYDVEAGIFYEDAYQRQYIEVEYYYDELGREVVDCTVCDFLCVKEGEYYPIYAQRLINVKDCSTTKYAVTYRRENEFVDPINGNDDAYDKNDMYDYGINTLIVQLDYSSGQDVTLMKANYETADKHHKLLTSGTVAYYKKSADSTIYYSNVWDNAYYEGDNDMSGYIPGGYGVNYYPEDLISKENRERFHNRLGDALISIPELRYNYTCIECKRLKNTSDGVFIDCSHLTLYPSVTRYVDEIISNDEKYFSDYDSVLQIITGQLQRFANNLAVEYALSLKSGAEFGNSFNDFVVGFGKKYYAEKVDAEELGKIEEFINANAVRIDQYEYPKEMKGKLTFTYGIKDDSVMDGEILQIAFSTDVSISDPASDKEYYLCTTLMNREDNDDYTILSKTEIDPTSDQRIKVDYKTDLTSLIEAWLTLNNAGYGRGYVPSYAIMSYSDEKGYEYLYGPRTIDIDTRNCVLEKDIGINVNGEKYICSLKRYNDGLEIVPERKG